MLFEQHTCASSTPCLIKAMRTRSVTISLSLNGCLVIHMQRTYLTIAHKRYFIILFLIYISAFLHIVSVLQLRNVLYKSTLLLRQRCHSVFGIHLD